MKKAELLPLTGIRFYAALLVFCAHLTDFPGLEWLRRFHFFDEAGALGVSVFFVLSGFILTYNYADVFQSGVTIKAWGRFLWNRLCKIYPTYLLTLVVALPLQVFSPNLPLDWRAVPVQVLLMQCMLPFGNPPLHAYMNAPSWSIGCEFFFYLLAPFAIFYVGRGFRRFLLKATVLACPVLAIVCLSLLSGCVEHSNPSRVADSGLLSYLEHRYFTYYFGPTRFVEFLGGVLVAFAYKGNSASMSERATTTLAGAAMLLLLIGGWMQQLIPWPFQDAMKYMPGGVLLIYVLSRGTGALARHLSARPLKVLGMASFAFYLIHMPVIRCVRGVLRHFDILSPSWPVITVIVMGTFLAIQACAIALCWRFELPMQKVLKRAFDRFGKSHSMNPAGN